MSKTRITGVSGNTEGVSTAVFSLTTRDLRGTVFFSPTPTRLYPAPTRSRYILILCLPAVRFESFSSRLDRSR